MKTGILFLYFKTFLWIGLYSQSFPQFDLITLEDGISNGFVTSLCQDEKGFIWMGTPRGLNRYDGYEFKFWLPSESSSNNPSSDLIWTVKVDSKGNIWAGTEHGLNKFNPSTETFTPYFHEKENSTSLSHNTILAIEEDVEGNIWIGTGHGLNVLRKGANGFQRYASLPGTTLGQSTKALLSDSEDKLWVGALDTLYRYQSNHSFKGFPIPAANGQQLNANYIRSLYEDSRNRLWVGTEQSGVFVFDKKKQQFIKNYSTQNSTMPLSHDKVSAIVEDDFRQIWVGTYGGGLNILNEKKQKVWHLSDLANGLDAEVIRGMLKDKAGNIWLGTSYEGLYIVKRYKKQFRNYSSQNTTIKNSKTCIFFERPNGDILIGTKKGLYNFEPETEKIKYLDWKQGTEQIFPSIISMVESSDGVIWAITENDKLVFYDTKNKKAGVLKPSEYGCGDWMKIIFVDANNHIWIGTMTGLCQYKPESQEFIKHPLAKNRQTNGDNSNVEVVFIENEEAVWIGTYGGINHLKVGEDTLTYYPSVCPVYMIKNKNEEQLWLGTKEGLAIFDKKQKKYQFFKHLDAMPPVVFGIEEDKNGQVWMATQTGIYCFSPKMETVIYYNKKDGLINNQFLHGSLQNTNGELYFTGISGFVRFHPDDIVQNPLAPSIEVTNFKIFNQNVPIQKTEADTLEWASPLEKGISYTQNLVLPHFQNDISFEFTALDFTAPANNAYQYQLAPYDKTWLTTTAEQRFANYTNLSPGKYIFRVKGSNNDLIWNEQSKEILITILPPWWQTWWAYFLYAISLLAIVLVIRQYELNRLKATSEARRLQELDVFKTRLYTNITHEFRTPLTIILGVTDQLSEKLKGYYQDSLDMIQRNGNQLLQLVNQMLDLNKLEAGKLELNLVQGDVITYLKYLTEAVHSMAAAKNIDLHFESGVEELIMDYDPTRLQQVMLNLLSNAVKFTPNGGSIKVKALQEFSSLDFLFLQIQDSGIGISSEKLPHIFDRFYQADDTHTRQGEGTGIGLALTKELIKLMQGTIEVESQIGQGSTFTVILPIQKSHTTEKEKPKTAHFVEQQTAFETSVAIKNATEKLTQSQPKSSKKLPQLLLIEDNADVIQYLATTLSSKYEINTAPDGQAGINQAFEIIPDLIISDVMMPKKDGFEVCQILKNDERTSHIPIIMLTAKADFDSKMQGLERGADAYLPKPFERKELLLRIQKLLELRKNLQAFYRKQLGIKDKKQTREKTPKPLQLDAVQQAFLEKINALCEENYGNPKFTVEELSKGMLLSSSQLLRKFKALTGLSPKQLIQKVRLEKAKELLQNPKLSIADVAYEVGFTDPNYFSKVFKKAFGGKPSEFRIG